jgi:hypothetical protein
MYANLPDELIKNVLTYWSPKHAHKSKVVNYLMNKVDKIDNILWDFKENRYGKHSIKREDMKEMIDLFNRFGNIPQQISMFYSVKMTKKLLVVKVRKWNGKPVNKADHYCIENYSLEHFDKLYEKLPKGDSNYDWGLRNAHRTQVMKSQNTQEFFTSLIRTIKEHIIHWGIENMDIVIANGYRFE